MKKSLRLLSAFMALVMLAGMLSVGASAAHSDYLDSAILENYNSIDQVSLTTDQQASLLLDRLDIILEDEDIYIDIPLIGDINLRSIDSALDSIYSITNNWLFGSMTVGDLSVLETHNSDIATARRAAANTTDTAVIEALVTYLGNCAPTLVKIIDDSINWGMVKGFLPPEFRVIIADLPGFVKETVWDALHPVNTAPVPSNLTLDSLVQFMCDNQLGGANAQAMGFDGLLPGFTLNLATANAYRTFEEAIYCALNQFVLPLINNELKNVINDAVVINSQQGGSIQTFVNLDYVVAEYEFNREQGLVEQLNTMLGTVVNQMLLPGQDLFTWDFTLAADQTLAGLLSDNLTRLLKVIIPLGGETVDVSGDNLQQLGNYIARSAVEQFVKHMSLGDEDSMARVAYLGLRELAASKIPGVSYADTPGAGEDEDYQAAIIEIGADFGAYYFNNMFDFNCDISTTAAEFIDELVVWAVNYAEGLVDVSDFVPADTGWKKVDKIIWDIIPKNWLPYAQMFATDTAAGTEGDLDILKLINYLLETVFTFDVEKLFTLFSHNSGSTLSSLTARQSIINVVSSIINGAFPGTIPPGIDEFEDLMNLTTLKAIVQNLLVSLSSQKSTLVPTALRLISDITGVSKEQSLGKAALSIEDRIDCTSGAIPANQKIRITNLSKGVNRGWRNAAGTLNQDQMYKIALVSINNNAGLTLGSIPNNTVINANGFFDVAVSGTVAATTQARFDLTYNILDEEGQIINSTPLVASTYSHLYTQTGNYELTSAETASANRVSMGAFPTYLYTTDIYDAAVFSIMATNNGSVFGNGTRDVRRALVTGTMPAGLSANNPETGKLVALDSTTALVDAYGTVAPYLLNRDPDDPQPYGIYDLSIRFEICNTGESTGSLTDARDHKIVVYNDFGLPGLLEQISDANRQYADYVNAQAEWNAYQSAVAAGYSIIQGNPDHSIMFADVTNPDGSQNGYYAAATAIRNAVTALDAKLKPTDAALLESLETTLNAQNAPAGNYFDSTDYVLYTYDRWNNWNKHARGLINSQKVTPGVTPAPVIPVILDLDLKYAKHMLELFYPRMIPTTAVKTHLNAAITAAGNKTQADYAPDTWADYAQALAFANEVSQDSSADLRQSKVNDARVKLMKAERNLKAKLLLPAANSTTVIDSKQMFIYGLEPNLSSINDKITLAPAGHSYTVTPYGGNSIIGTGTFVKVFSQAQENQSAELLGIYTVVIYGDLNGDGIINSNDYFVIEDYLSGIGTEQFFAGGPFFTAADVNRDGVIDELDLSLIDKGEIDQF